MIYITAAFKAGLQFKCSQFLMHVRVDSFRLLGNDRQWNTVNARVGFLKARWFLLVAGIDLGQKVMLLLFQFHGCHLVARLSVRVIVFVGIAVQTGK